MLPISESDLRRFEEHTGLDALASSGPMVCANWRSLVATKPGWGHVEPNVSGISPEGVMASWLFDNGASQLRLELFVSSISWARAHRFISQLAWSASSLAFPPYRVQANGIGELCLVGDDPEQVDMIWVRHNVGVRAWLVGRQVDLFDFALQLDRQIQAGVCRDVELHKPHISNVEISRLEAAVGDLVHVKVHAQHHDPEELVYEFKTPPELTIRDVEGPEAKVRLDEAGLFQIEVVVYDRQTLLSSGHSVALTVNTSLE